MSSRYPLPYAFARSQQLLLEEADDGRHTLWMSSHPARSAVGEVARKYGVQAFEVLADGVLAQRISAAYSQGESSAAAVVSEVQNDADLSRMMQELPAVEDLLASAGDAPIIRMLNALLTQAARDGASDIHIEPYERTSSVRFRIDGTLREVVQPNRALHAALISRLKIMADLDISEKRLPQDGRISLRIGTRAVDVRVSTLPSAHGERAVLRLLDKSESKLTLESVGMQGDMLHRFEKLISQPHGIILVTGPTGSGKTTTLYAALARLDASRSNIMTVEDPIEYELPGVGQTQINAKIELTFNPCASSSGREVEVVHALRKAECRSNCSGVAKSKRERPIRSATIRASHRRQLRSYDANEPAEHRTGWRNPARMTQRSGSRPSTQHL